MSASKRREYLETAAELFKAGAAAVCGGSALLGAATLVCTVLTAAGQEAGGEEIDPNGTNTLLAISLAAMAPAVIAGAVYGAVRYIKNRRHQPAPC